MSCSTTNCMTSKTQTKRNKGIVRTATRKLRRMVKEHTIKGKQRLK